MEQVKTKTERKRQEKKNRKEEGKDNTKVRMRRKVKNKEHVEKEGQPRKSAVRLKTFVVSSEKMMRYELVAFHLSLEAFADYHRDDVFKLDGFVTNAFFANVKNISSKLINSSSNEAFYTDYYGEIIFNCQSYFPSLDSTHGSLLTTELCEKIVNEVQFLTSPEVVTIIYIS